MHTDDYFSVGEQLLATADKKVALSEALARAGIAELYYHAYHVGLYYAEYHLDYKSWTPPQTLKGSHELLWGYYEYLQKDDLYELAYQLYSKRIQAHYYPEKDFAYTKAKDWTELTNDLVKEIIAAAT